MAGNTRQVINMANSIVGVSILSMPFCFKETGLLLGIVLVLISGFITKKTCMFLIRSAIMARRRSYEFLAFHVFGVSGKLFVELCMILFLIGICVSFHVVMGDLAPGIVARVMNVENSPSLRCTLLIGIALLVILPLCLLRNLDNLASMSACSIMFYFFLITVILWHAFPKLWDGTWVHVAELWRLSGALQVFPICCLGLACQSNIFEIYDSVPDPDVPKMRFVVNHAVNLCSALYISVGFLGYVAFVDKDFGGNIIMSFPNSELTEGIKVFFIVSLAISFPLMIFPCRTSIHSLFYRRSNPSSFDLVGNYMPESRFKGITFGILVFSLIIGILIPNIEFVLGLLGSTMGMLIALILPSLLFIKVNTKASSERLLAQAIMLMGVLLIVTGTYLNMVHIYDRPSSAQIAAPTPETTRIKTDPQLPKFEEKIAEVAKPAEVLSVGVDLATRKEPVAPEPPPEDDKDSEKEKSIADNDEKDKMFKEVKKLEKDHENIEEKTINKEMMKKEANKDMNKSDKLKEDKKEGDTLHPDAIQKEEKENEEEKDKGPGNTDIEKKQAEILEKIEQQHQKQQQILEVQEKILKELEDAKVKQQEEAKKQEESKINAAAAVNAPVINDGAISAPLLPAGVGNAPVPVLVKNSESFMGASVPQNMPGIGGQINPDLAKNVPADTVQVDINQGNNNNNLPPEVHSQAVVNQPIVNNEDKGQSLSREPGVISQHSLDTKVQSLPIAQQFGLAGGINPQEPLMYSMNQAEAVPVQRQEQVFVIPLENHQGSAAKGFDQLNTRENYVVAGGNIPVPLGNNPSADDSINVRGVKMVISPNIQKQSQGNIPEFPPKDSVARPIVSVPVPAHFPVKDINNYVTGQRNSASYDQKHNGDVGLKEAGAESVQQVNGLGSAKQLSPQLNKLEVANIKTANKKNDSSGKLEFVNQPLDAKEPSIVHDEDFTKEKQLKGLMEVVAQSDGEKAAAKFSDNSKLDRERLSLNNDLDKSQNSDKAAIMKLTVDELDQGIAHHDEERRKRQADAYIVDLPHADLLKELKWKDVGDFAYDTRHLLWTGRSRRRKRNKGRDEDYYWDET